MTDLTNVTLDFIGKQVAALQGEVTRLRDENRALARRIFEVEASLVGVDRRLGEIETRLGGIETRLGDVDKGMGALNGRFDKLFTFLHERLGPEN
jgi:hypothetical protein